MCLDKAVNSSQGLLNDEVASYLTFLCGSGRVESLVDLDGRLGFVSPTAPALWPRAPSLMRRCCSNTQW